MGSFLDREELEEMTYRMNKKVVVFVGLAYTLLATYYFFNKIN